MANPRKFLFLFVLLALPIVYTAAHPLVFYAADFKITVNNLQSRDMPRKEKILIERELGSAEINAEIRESLSKYTFSGKGTTKIKDQIVKVKFKNLKIKYLRFTNKFLLVDGVILSNSDIVYRIDECVINIDAGNLIINPNGGEAKVILSYEERNLILGSSLNMNCRKATIFSNGSLCSKEFRTSANFKLAGGNFEFNVTEARNQSVSIGDASCNFQDGIRIDCNSKLGRLNFHSVIVIHPKFGSTSAHSKLTGSEILIPECKYELAVSGGEIDYEIKKRIILAPIPSPHRPSGNSSIFQSAFLINTTNAFYERDSILERENTETNPSNFVRYKYSNDISGYIIARTTIPLVVPDLEGNPIVLRDIKFNFNNDESISSAVTPPPFKLLDFISLIPKEKSGWLYFAPGWYAEKGKYSCDVDSTCKFTLQDLASSTDMTRPGLTVFNGYLEYSFRQIQPFEIVHSPFWGSLTVMPNGITGDCTSGGFSIVPGSMPDTVIMVRELTYNLQQIIDHGNDLPPDIKPLYRLSKLSILDMTMDSLTVCNNKLQSSKFNYTVHFPHPSYININYADKSIDATGWFSKAYGPELQGDLSIEEIITMSEDLKPHEIPKYNVKGVILWFWHLPTLLYEKGIEINHMPDYARVDINYADFMIAPLSNTDTARKGGISYRGNLNHDGIFSFYDVDSTNYFGKLGSRGFKSYLETLEIASLDQLPESREYDARWTGLIELPFFKRQPINIHIDDLIARQMNKIAVDVAGGTPELGKLRVITDDLTYQYDQGGFEDIGVKYSKSMNGVDWSANTKGNLYINAYTDGIILGSGYGEEIIPLGSSQESDECGRPIQYKQQLKCPVGSIDIVCYDEAAISFRIAEDSAINCGNYRIGDFEMIAEEKVVWKIPKVRYYPETQGIETAFSQSVFKPYENDLDIDLNMQAVKLYVDMENGVIVGDLAISTDDFPLDLPISGDAALQFKVNTNCGYFYFYSKAEINFGYSFNGMVFIAHDLFGSMDNPIGNYENPIEKVRKDVFVNRGTMVETYLGNPDPENNLLTGFIGTGGAGIDILGFEVDLIGGFFYFNIHDFQNSSNNNRMGIITAVKAVIDIPGAEAAISVSGAMYGSTIDPEVGSNVQLCICGCLELDTPFGSLAYLLASASVGVNISSKDGLDVNGIGFGTEAGLGDCPCDGDPCPQ